MLFGAASSGQRTFGDLAWHAPVVTATDGALPANTLSPASGTHPGQTMTANANGNINTTAATPLHAIPLSVGDRLLVRGESGDADGIYVVTTLGDGTHPWVLTRASDADTDAELPIGSLVATTTGSDPDWPRSLWMQLSPSPGGAWSRLPSATDDLYTLGTLDATGPMQQAGVAGALAPVGTILPYGGSAAPSGWLLCQGQSVLRATYPNLFAAIGTNFGAADGTHFSLPDMRNRFPIGAGSSAALASSGGSFSHTHTSAAHSHSHNHGFTDTAWAQVTGASSGDQAIHLRLVTGITSWTSNRVKTYGTPGAGSAAAKTEGAAIDGTTNTDATSTTPGATGSANPPYLSLNYIIRAE